MIGYALADSVPKCSHRPRGRWCPFCNEVNEGATLNVETSPRAKSEPPPPKCFTCDAPAAFWCSDNDAHYCSTHATYEGEHCDGCHPLADPVLKAWNEAPLDDALKSAEEKAAAEEARKHVSAVDWRERCLKAWRETSDALLKARDLDAGLEAAKSRIAELEAALRMAEEAFAIIFDNHQTFHPGHAAKAIAFETLPVVRAALKGQNHA